MEDFVTPEQCRDIFKCNPSLEPKKRIVKKKKQQQQQQRSKLDKQGEPSQLEKDAGLGEISIGAEGEESDLLVKLDDAIWDADGDSFEMALDQFNRGMRKLKESGAMKENLSRMPGVKEAVWTRITNQAYDRTVSPRVGELRNYKAFSDEV